MIKQAHTIKTMNSIRTLTVLLTGLTSLLAASAILAAEASAKAAIKIAIIGDSTVCDYPETSNIRGWGQFVAPYFEDSVTITNLAASGRSTKTFIKEGRWTRTLQAKPDYILIQFGHNDSHEKTKPEATDADTDYKEYLRQYITEARQAGATPILITPMHRRTFSKDGTMTQELLPYANAMKAVAKEKQVPLVDLQTSSGVLFEKLGDAASTDLNCELKDRTHFSPKGAKAIAELVVKELREVEPTLKPYWRN